MKNDTSQPAAAPVRRRFVYYLSGFDPRGARFYHQLYKTEAARQEAVNGWRYEVGSRQRAVNHVMAWQVNSHCGEQQTETRYAFLSWDDLIRDHWQSTTRGVLGLLPRFYGRYGLDGGLKKLHQATHLRGFWTLMLPLLYAALALLLAGLAALGMHWLLGNWGQSRLIGALAGLALAAGILKGAMAGAEQIRLLWLLRIIAFVPHWGRTRPAALEQRCAGFAAQIHADLRADQAQNPHAPLDEVLIVGHSVGTLMAVIVAERYLALAASSPQSAPVKLLTLGSIIPLLGIVPEAGWFRAQLASVGNSAMPWMDYTAPSDPLCCALLNPLTASGLPVPAGAGPCIKSARFDKMFLPADYAPIKKDIFRAHFQYLMATSLPVGNDYFSLTAGALPLSLAQPASASQAPSPGYTPPRPGTRSKSALLGGLLAKDGRSMLNLLPPRIYTAQMSVVRIARHALYIVNAPQTLRQVLIGQACSYPKHHYLADILKPLIGYSLFNANGPAWEQQRRLVDQAFVQAGLRRAFSLMQTAITDMLGRCDAIAGAKAWDTDSAMSHVTADIIFRTILSTPLDAAQAEKVHAAFRRYQSSAQRVMGLSALHLPTFYHRWRCRQQGAAIRQPFAELIRQRYRAVERGERDLPDDMLSTLMQARDPETGAGLSQEEVIDQVGTLFLAGHETSASTLCWALYLLACQPQLQDQVRQEITAAWGQREPQYGDTRTLTLTQNVFKETLRLYPPIAFYLREAAQPGCLRDKPVATGDMVVVSPWIVQRHQQLWERPDEFDPKRFGTEAGRASAKTAYLPFGVGPRACPGAAFATQESLLILAQLVRRYRIEPVAEHVPQPTARLTLRSANGMQLRLVRLDS